MAVHLEVPGFLGGLDRAAADDEQVAALEQSIAGWSQIMQQVLEQQAALQLPKVHGQRLLTWTPALQLPLTHACTLKVGLKCTADNCHYANSV